MSTVTSRTTVPQPHGNGRAFPPGPSMNVDSVHGVQKNAYHAFSPGCLPPKGCSLERWFLLGLANLPLSSIVCNNSGFLFNCTVLQLCWTFASESLVHTIHVSACVFLIILLPQAGQVPEVVQMQNQLSLPIIWSFPEAPEPTEVVRTGAAIICESHMIWARKPMGWHNLIAPWIHHIHSSVLHNIFCNSKTLETTSNKWCEWNEFWQLYYTNGFFFIHLLMLHVCTYEHVYHSPHVEVRGHFSGAGSFLLLCGSWGLELRFGGKWLYSLNHLAGPLTTWVWWCTVCESLPVARTAKAFHFFLPLLSL